MSMFGNTTFTGVQNYAGQLPYLDVSELLVVNANIGDLIISGNITLTGDLTVGGQIFEADGTAGAPSYSYTIHPTDGIYFNSAGPQPPGVTAGVAISTDGINRFQIGGGGGASLVTGDLTISNGAISLTGGNLQVVTGNINVLVGQIETTAGGLIISGKSQTVVGQGLVRASTVISCDWEDGHLGNSEFLYFTPTDFRNASNSRIHGVNSGAPAADGPAFVIETDANVVDIVAAKLIPKGFRIKAIADSGDPDGLAPAVYSMAASGPGAVNAVALFQQPMVGEDTKILRGRCTNPTWGGGVTIWDGGGGGSPVTVGTTSNGTLNCILYIDMGVDMTILNGITGARVSIERV